jgi:hypothetical protein
MFRDEREQNRFMLAFVIAWLINFALGLFALGASNVLLVNTIYAIGGGQWAPADQSVGAFFRGMSVYAPAVFIVATIATLISLFLGRFLASKYPNNHYAAFALAGSIAPLAVGLITLSFNWIGAFIGIVAVWPAAKLLRPQDIPPQG